MSHLPDPKKTAELFAKLEGLGLEPPQKALLSAILEVAADTTDDPESPRPKAFGDDFASAFTPDKVKLIMDYSAAASSTRMIVRGGHPPTTTTPPPTTTTPPMIVRFPLPSPTSGHASDDDD
jgi:hypothetical protein